MSDNKHLFSAANALKQLTHSNNIIIQETEHKNSRKMMDYERENDINKYCIFKNQWLSNR